MGIMDLTINQEVMGAQSKFGNHVFQLKEYNETDVKGNNNFYNSRKTDTSNDPSSLFRDGYSSENLHVDPSLFSYSSFKKAMDLRTHNRRDDENTRTIFDDADYFAKNFFYKLLPITFEQVDETIIQSEHNYSLCSLNSESEAEEDCSRTMDYSQIKEKNYKRRRTKFRDESDAEQREEEWDENKVAFDSNQNIPNQKECPEPEPDLENAMQPLDLSAAPPVQEHKTDYHCYHLKEDSDSVEDNLHSKLNWIQVTITRPDEKENYQPCDMFLNDIARLVPRLINNDCFEIDILDKTGHPHDDLHTHRLYYIIAQSTWRLFQSTSERVILTNDYTIGPPVKKIEKDERPTFLVFDQFSLAKCLAEYCQEIGGCFEYTCVEEGKENEREVVKSKKMIEVETKGYEKAGENEEMTEMVPKETTVEIDTKGKTQIEEMKTNPEEEVAKEIIHVSEDFKMDIENISMESTNAILKINLSEAEARSDLTAIKFGESVANRKTKEISVGKIKNFNLKRNETEENVREIKMSLSGSLEPKETETNENRKKQGKLAVRNKKRKRKLKISAEDLQSSTVESEVKNIEVEIKKKAKKEAIIFTHVKNSEPDKVDAKEGKSIETNTNINVTESTEAKTEINIENENEYEKFSKGTIAEDIEIKEKDMIVERTKSDEENENAKEEEENVDNKIIVDVHMKKKRGKKVIKKRKKEVKERKADAVCIEKAKKDMKEKGIGIKTTKAKEAETNSKGKKTNNVSAKSRKETKSKMAKGKPLEETKKFECLEAKNKEKRPEIEKAKKLPLKKIRSKIKPKNDPPLSQPQIKTRSKSTSESETSQKPNKEIKKTKNTVKEIQKEVKEIKEFTERKTRSGKLMAEKKDVQVKENGMRVRGKKRKPEEEEILEERRLRSRGEKMNVDKVNIPSKRRKR